MAKPDFTSERFRAYVYRVLTGIGAILVLHGVVTAEELESYLLLAANVLGTGLAAVNTSTKKEN